MNSNFLFVPWLRRGIGTQIDRFDDGTSETRPGVDPTRARFQVTVEFNGDTGNPADKKTAGPVTLALHGPGDIAGLDTRTIVRTWPAENVFEAEPNFFPVIEFDQADLPWRYTPAQSWIRKDAAKPDRLRPWLCLIALKDSEVVKFTPPDGTKGRIAQVIVSSTAVLPDLAQSWGWAHTQVLGAASAADVIAALADRTRVVSRLMCARRLEDRTAYTCYLVPAFERGRLAGLGATIAPTLDAMKAAWDPASPATNYPIPVYYLWRFQTGVDGDFRSLARRLQPRSSSSLPAHFGRRQLDTSNCAPTWGNDKSGNSLKPPSPLGATPLPFEGAIRTPFVAGTTTPIDWASLSVNPAWATTLAKRLNDPRSQAYDPTKKIMDQARVAPPLYGRWHANQHTLDAIKATDDGLNWFRELNTDPRLRVAAGLGAQAVEQNREPLLAGAWQVYDQLRQINESLRHAQLSREAMRVLHREMFPSYAAAARLVAPVKSDPTVARDADAPHVVEATPLPPPPTSTDNDPRWIARPPAWTPPARPATHKKTAGVKPAAAPTPKAHSLNVDHTLRLLAPVLGDLLSRDPAVKAALHPTFRKLRRPRGPIARRQRRHVETAHERDERQIVERLHHRKLRPLPRPGGGGVRPLSPKTMSATEYGGLVNSIDTATWNFNNLGELFYQFLIGGVQIQMAQYRTAANPNGLSPFMGPECLLIGQPQDPRVSPPNAPPTVPFHDQFTWSEDLASVAAGTKTWADTGWSTDWPTRNRSYGGTLSTDNSTFNTRTGFAWPDHNYFTDPLGNFAYHPLYDATVDFRGFIAEYRARLEILSVNPTGLTPAMVNYLTTTKHILSRDGAPDWTNTTMRLEFDPSGGGLAKTAQITGISYRFAYKDTPGVPIIPSLPPADGDIPAAPATDITNTPGYGNPPRAQPFANHGPFRKAFYNLLTDISLKSRPIPHVKQDVQEDLTGVLPITDPTKAAQLLDPKKTIEEATTIRLKFTDDAVTVNKPSYYDPLDPVLASPEFTQPMADALQDLSPDWLFSSMDQTPANSILLLEANTKFIEAYMVGLNYQLGRVLLFNEYPTDQRGTYFRHFWDKSTRLSVSPGTLAKDLPKDIAPIHTWTKPATPIALGAHTDPDNPNGHGTLLLAIRGDLLHRYPNTVIYAVPAKFNGSARVPDTSGATPDKHPLFAHTLDPDALLLGFDLTPLTALGSPTPADNKPGWFFVIQEQHTAPRFGLEPYTAAKLKADGSTTVTRDAVEWGDFVAVGADPSTLVYVDLDHVPRISDAGAGVHWPANMRSSDVAWVTCRKPARVAIHASLLLPT